MPEDGRRIILATATPVNRAATGLEPRRRAGAACCVLFVMERQREMQVAYYQASIPAFLLANDSEILGKLTRVHGFVLEQGQRDAWLEEISIMRQAVFNLQMGHILFEFAIPRVGKRADVVLVVCGIIFILEFKTSATFEPSAIEQAYDYALDIKNFHRGSHELPIVPFLVATRAGKRGEQEPQWALDMVAAPLLANPDELPQSIDRVIKSIGGAPIDFDAWVSSGYQPSLRLWRPPRLFISSMGSRRSHARMRAPEILA